MNLEKFHRGIRIQYLMWTLGFGGGICISSLGLLVAIFMGWLD